jgi:hypothetical protein
MVDSKLSRDSDRPELFHGFPQSLKTDVRIVPRVGYGRFLPNPFQFIVSSIVLSYRSALQSRDADGAVKITHKRKTKKAGHV